jgi:hypothetical protein
MAKITKKETLKALENVVKGNEDYIYVAPKDREHFDGTFGSDCWYSDADGNPSCIVGFVAQKLAPEFFKELVKFENTKGVSESIVNTDAGTYFSDAALRALKKAQSAQDYGMTWGESLKDAEKA